MLKNMITINELKDKLDEVIEKGYGNLPIEIYQEGSGGSTRVADVLYDEISLTLYDFI